MTLHVPDWLPALVNCGRAFVTIGAMELSWVVTAWPNGAFAIVFAAIVVLLLLAERRSGLRRGDGHSLSAPPVAVLCAAVVKFALLPGLETFPAFCMGLGLVLIPAGFGLAQSQQPAMIAVLTALAFNFVPLLAADEPDEL